MTWLIIIIIIIGNLVAFEIIFGSMLHAMILRSREIRIVNYYYYYYLYLLEKLVIDRAAIS
jgi:hypothetical protein